MPTPIRFTCSAHLPQSPEDIAAAILDLDNWPQFKGWGPIPGIRSARFERRTDGIVGSVIATTNTDGSTHTEEILEWDPPRRIVMRLTNFSRPLSLIASEFKETWHFTPGTPTQVRREFELYPRTLITRPLLWLISLLLKQAIKAQLKQLATSD